MLAGKLLADLGADVIKIEPPGGSSSRHRGPFIDGIPHPQKSLFWSGLNLDKRSVTIDVARPTGRELFFQLAQCSDIILESFTPGYLDSLKMGYGHLRQRHPGIILASITPFGQTGPYSSYKGPDIVSWALGGYLWMTGDPDHPPLRVGGVEQAAQYGAVSAVGATLLALRQRAQTGHGQHVDQSTQQCGPWMLFQSLAHTLATGAVGRRGGTQVQWGRTFLKQTFACKDGHLYMTMGTGILSRGLMGVVEWMKAEGMASPSLQDIDSSTYDPTNLEQSEADALSASLSAFFLTKTKQEVLDGALARGLFITPINTVKDVVESPHFKAHNFWVHVDHQESGRSLSYPASPIRFAGNQGMNHRRAPVAGADADGVLTQLLGIPAEGVRPPGKGGKALATEPASKTSSKRPAGETYPPPKTPGRGRPMHGLKVLDLTATVAGPVVTRLLADYGATVVKVESDKRPDSGRSSTPYVGEPGLNRSLYFPFANSGKYSFGIDMSKPGAARFVAQHLVPWADVIVDSFAPGVMEKWGLTYESISAVNPKAILARICFIGHDGPLRNLKGFGNNASALSGISHLTAWKDGPPLGPYLAYGDHLAAYYTLAAIMAALEHRERTGKGHHIQVSILASILSLLTAECLDYQANGHERGPIGNWDDHAAPHGVYPCLGEDEWCAIAITSDTEWKALGKIIGEAWGTAARFASFERRREHQKELDQLIGKWTATWNKQKLMKRLQQAGVPAGAVQSHRDILRDPQLIHRRHLIRLNHPELGWHYTHTSTFRLSDAEGLPARCTPLLGEHTYSISKEVLGISDDAIAGYFSEFLQ